MDIALKLDPSLDISVVEQLHESLNGITQKGDTIYISGESVERIDTSVLQLLYSYQQSTDKKQASVYFVHPSDTFLENVKLLGLDHVLNIKH